MHASGLTELVEREEDRNDSLQVNLDKLDAMLAPSSTSALDAGLLAEMLSLPNDGRYPVLDLHRSSEGEEHSKLFSQIVAFSRKNHC
jgi:hypothetical protein